MMIEGYDGTDLIDTADERIGTVERSYIDDTGAVRFVAVKMGGFRAKHRLVPVDQIERTDDALKVPFSKDIVEQSPDASSAGDTLESETLDEVRAYYSRSQVEEVGTAESGEAPAAVPVTESQAHESPSTESSSEGISDKAKRAVEQIREKLPGANSGAAGTQDESDAGHGDIGQVRDLGDVIEIPIVEEELVKRPVVKEVLRIRKSSTTEQQSVGAELRREEVEVDRQGDAKET